MPQIAIRSLLGLSPEVLVHKIAVACSLQSPARTICGPILRLNTYGSSCDGCSLPIYLKHLAANGVLYHCHATQVTLNQTPLKQIVNSGPKSLTLGNCAEYIETKKLRFYCLWFNTLLINTWRRMQFCLDPEFHCVGR